MAEFIAYAALVILVVVIIVVVRAGAVDSEKATDALEAGGRSLRERASALWAKIRRRT